MSPEPDPQAGKVFVVLQGPDMTYYGDAELHGLYLSRESAEAKAREVDPRWTGDEYEPVRVFECEIEP